MADKVEAKHWVAEKIGEEHIIPTLAVYKRVEDIDFDALPDRFVIKCNHNSGTGMYICHDKSKMDRKAVIRGLRKGLRENFFNPGREWPYKNVPRRIIVEQYMEDTNSPNDLKDYKFFCFDGKVKALFIASDRMTEGAETKFDFFDSEFNHLPIKNGHPNSTNPITKPQSFDLMKQLASKLSRGIPHVRVDFYEVNGKVYFGEMTFFHWGGQVPFEPEEWDYKFGEWIHLPQKTYQINAKKKD